VNYALAVQSSQSVFSLGQTPYLGERRRRRPQDGRIRRFEQCAQKGGFETDVLSCGITGNPLR
jgi:hypothetical protein